MNVTKETITPKKAMEWLKRNVHNRPRSSAFTSRIASAMKQRCFPLTGDTIKFNGNGDLIDGQHRLYACVEAGVSFDSYVARGLPHEAFDYIDQGRRRSSGDVLARHGEKHYNMLAAAALVAQQIKSTRVCDNGHHQRPDQIVAFIAANPTIKECCEVAVTNDPDRLVPRSIVAGLLFLFRSVDSKKADAFWTRVLTGESVTKGMIEYRLRARLIENRASPAKLRRQPMCALIIKAFNSVVTGRDLKVLKWGDDESFPLIEGFKYDE